MADSEASTLHEPVHAPIAGPWMLVGGVTCDEDAERCYRARVTALTTSEVDAWAHHGARALDRWRGDMDAARRTPRNRVRAAADEQAVSPSNPKPPGIGERPLLEQVERALRARRRSPRTVEAYTHWIRRFILFHGKRHPKNMGEAEVASFVSSLANDRHLSASSQSQALSAVLFLYRRVLRQDVGWIDGIARARRPQRVIVDLTRSEVRAVLAHMPDRHALMAKLLYGAGLRLMEVCGLRVKDVDLARRVLTIRKPLTECPGAVRARLS